MLTGFKKYLLLSIDIIFWGRSFFRTCDISPLSGAIKKYRFVFASIIFLCEPTPGSTTHTKIDRSGKYLPQWRHIGDEKGGDARGKQSAALLVVKKNAGYGGYTDRAIDIRVDDHPEPFKELGRLLKIAQVNYSWNEAWTLFTQKKYADALPHMERSARLAPENAEVFYDLAVIRLANGKESEALEALEKALSLNPKLRKQASEDSDLSQLKGNSKFENLIKAGKN